jgi:predicted amidophosphoribosyltransferase
MGDGGLGRLISLAAAAADLVLPGACAGCGAERVALTYGTCAGCVTVLEALTPYPTAPMPRPAGMPPCEAVGPYAGELRGLLLAYKEKGRYRLARPLGVLLAGAVAQAAVRGGGGVGVPLLVLPVPSTVRAARQRHGDHLARLAAHTVRALRAAGWQARASSALAASPRPDSVSLDAAGRAAAAVNSLRIRPARMRDLRRRVTAGGMLVVLDDIVTTGATLAAVTARLNEADVQVTGAAVLAATQLRRPPTISAPGLPPGGTDWANRRESVPRTRGDGRASAG